MRWIMVLMAFLFAHALAGAQELQPFVLPWDDGSAGVTSMARLNHRPAGKHGHIIARNGRLFAGDQRIRLMGVNLSFAGNFPEKGHAPLIAARLAKLGINAVRFHHMDGQRFPRGIWHRDAGRYGEFDPEALDRLDFFIAALKREGIYTDLNLLVSRRFSSGDGLPEAIDRLQWKESHVPGFFDAGILNLQKEYARKLLTHRNPYTKKTYAAEPAVAIIEINNENGLVHSWLGGKVDELPDIYINKLEKQWNDWLAGRYESTRKLREAWRADDQPLGDEMLSERTWFLEQHQGARATLNVDGRSVRVHVTRRGDAGWHVQLKQSPLSVQKGRVYTVTFRARADGPHTASLLLSQDHAPWESIGLSGSIRLTDQWQDFTFTALARSEDDRARLIFSNLAGKTGEYEFSNVSMKPGGSLGLQKGQSLEARSVPILKHAGRQAFTDDGRLDWIRFLRDTEATYWQAMARHIMDALRCKALVIGTIIGCSTPNLMAELDVIDAHAYWQHPQFPDRPWDSENWIVPNQSMVNAQGGCIPGLSVRRIHGKPFFVTEYNHPAPNTYGSEMPLLLAAYGALQDWDGIFFYSYSHTTDWDSRKIDSFFDIKQHPTKLTNLPLAAAIFRDGQVAGGGKPWSVEITEEKEIKALATRGRAWRLIDGGDAGLDPILALQGAVGIRLNAEGAARSDGGDGHEMNKQVGQAIRSATGELNWDLSRKNKGVFVINADRMKAVAGFIAGRRFDLGVVSIEPGETMQDWCTIGLSMVEGRSFEAPERAILVATGYAQNTGMKWKNEKKGSVGHNWGQAPSLVEIVAALITIPGAAKVYALNEEGQREKAVTVERRGKRTVFSIGGAYRTLWYEIEWGEGG